MDEAADWHRKSLEIKESLGNKPGMAISFGQLGLLAEKNGNRLEALDWTLRAINLFDTFPHPSTGPAPGHLIRLTEALDGMDFLEQSWKRCMGGPLRNDIRRWVSGELEKQ